jgi:PPK2 family polyphosphate:nucleotide phosphotransferase
VTARDNPAGRTDPSASHPTHDPVCGMVVDPVTIKHSVERGGQSYYFCGGACETKFLSDPARYLRADSKPAHSAVGELRAVYTCPMHPQIRRNAPGSCPICGMALEVQGVHEGEGTSPELKDMTRRFAIGAVLATPIFVLEMGSHLRLLNLHHYLSDTVSMWIQFGLATPIVLWCAWPFFQRAWASVLNRSPNMFTLIALGVGPSYLYSLVATFAPGLFPASLHRGGGLIPVYYEAAAIVTVLVLLGQILELRAREKTGGAVRALLKLAPKTARRIGHDGTDAEVPLEEVRVGDRLRVRPGEAVPVDGSVTGGSSSVDESMVTGESVPVVKGTGAKVMDAVGTRTSVGAGDGCGRIGAQPSARELKHDFLWRTTCRLPERGRIGIFNRSYYEEVLITRVHPEILKAQNLPEHSLEMKHFWRDRYRSIVELEQHLHRNGTLILKFFLNLSKKEQEKRFLERIDEAGKNWKISAADIKERKYWKDYMRAYEECLSATGTPCVPWYAIPADDKDNARLIVSQIVIDALMALKMTYPKSDAKRRQELQSMRKQLAG